MRAGAWAAPALAWAAAACASLQPVSDPARFIAEQRPATVYVTHRNGAVLTLTRPRVAGDTLVGLWEGAGQELALPLADLRRIEARQKNTTRTILLISGVSMVGVTLGYLLQRERSSVFQECNFEGGHHRGACDIDDP